MSTARPRVALTLTDEARAVVESVRNRSEYVSELLERRTAAWRLALLHLRSNAGWSPASLLAACDALNGYAGLREWQDVVPDYLAMELVDAERLNGTATKWGAAAEWGGLIAALEPTTARALALVAEEFWLGNLELARRLEAPGSADDKPDEEPKHHTGESVRDYFANRGGRAK